MMIEIEAIYWYCAACAKARWPNGVEEKTPGGHLFGTKSCAQCGSPMKPHDEMHCVTSAPLDGQVAFIRVGPLWRMPR